MFGRPRDREEPSEGVVKIARFVSVCVYLVRRFSVSVIIVDRPCLSLRVGYRLRKGVGNVIGSLSYIPVGIGLRLNVSVSIVRIMDDRVVCAVKVESLGGHPVGSVYV